MQDAQTWEAYGHYLEKIARELCDVDHWQKARGRKDVNTQEQLVRQIMDKIGLINPEGAKKSAEDELKKLLAWTAANLGGMTPQMVAETMTSDEIPYVAYQILSQKHEKLSLLTQAQHDPEGATKTLKKLQEDMRRYKPNAKPQKFELMSLLNSANRKGGK